MSQDRSNHNNFSLDTEKEYLMTFSDYMQKALYDQKWGYYGAGKVAFGNHFETLAKDMAPLLAERCFAAWKGMLQTNEILMSEPFYIYEFGAGTGAMACIFLQHVHEMSVTSKDKNWSNFYQVISYHIGEISASLMKMQSKTLELYVALGKVNIYSADAQIANPSFPKGNGVVLSNELIDAFPAHQILVTYQKENLEIFPTVVAATIPETLLQGMIQKNAQLDFEGYKRKITSLEAKWNIPSEVIQKMRKDKRWIITIKNMVNLLGANASKYSEQIKMEKWTVPITALNDTDQKNIKAMIENAKSYLVQCLKSDKGDYSKILYLHLGLAGFYQNLQSFLKKGCVITIDYGSQAYGYFQDLLRNSPLRTYSEIDMKNIGNSKCPELEYPGQQDITVDVNFSDVAEVGKQNNFEVLYFGMQDSLGGPFIDFFKILIQQFGLTQESKSIFSQTLLQNLPSSSMVYYQDMPLLTTLNTEGYQIIKLLSPISVTKEVFVKRLKEVLIWFLEQKYFSNDRENIIGVEAYFINIFKKRLSLSFDHIFSIYKEFIDSDERYAKLLLTMLRHQTLGPKGVLVKANKSSVDALLTILEKAIVEKYPHLMVAEEDLKKPKTPLVQLQEKPDESNEKVISSLFEDEVKRLIREEKFSFILKNIDQNTLEIKCIAGDSFSMTADNLRNTLENLAKLFEEKLTHQNLMNSCRLSLNLETNSFKVNANDYHVIISIEHILKAPEMGFERSGQSSVQSLFFEPPQSTNAQFIKTNQNQVSCAQDQESAGCRMQ